MKRIAVLFVGVLFVFCTIIQAQPQKATINLINEKLKIFGWNEYGQELEYVSKCVLKHTINYKKHGVREVFHFSLKKLTPTIKYDDQLVTFQCLGENKCIESRYNGQSPEWIQKTYIPLQLDNREVAKKIAETLESLIQNCDQELA